MENTWIVKCHLMWHADESDDSDSSVRSNKDPHTKCSAKSDAGTRNSGSPLAVSSLKFIDRQGYVNKAYLETEDYMVSADEPSGVYKKCLDNL